jgi:glycosyltransferase involved in cell wall biosynthesis
MLLSIVVPTLNEELAIEKTLKQIHDNLTAYPYELIVADSESDDRTAEIARAYARVIITKRHHTIGWNRNQGAAAARGDFLIFIDADVFVPDPNHFFKIVVDDFAADPNLVGVTTQLNVFPEDATWLDNIVFGLTNLRHRRRNNTRHVGSASGEIEMIRRDAFEKLHGFQENLAAAEDEDMFVRLATIGRTLMEWRLTVYHTGRRAHQIGWPRLWLQWFLNNFYVKHFHRSYSSEWKQIR